MAMAAALSKVIRGGGSRASQSQLLLLPAMGRSRGPLEGFVRGLLPAMGATAPASTAAASPPLLRKVPSPCPVIPWRFHLTAGMQSSAHTGEQLARAPPPSSADAKKVPCPCPAAKPWQFHLMAGLRSSSRAREQLSHAPPASKTTPKEYVASIQGLIHDIEHMKERLKRLDYLWWVCVALALYTVFDTVPKLWKLHQENSKIKGDICACMETVEEVNEGLAHLMADLTDLEQQRVKPAPVVAPSEVVPSSATVDP